MDQTLSSITFLLCCWVALSSCMSIRKEADDALSALDKENAKKSSSSITEELARNLMEHLYDEIRKRSNSNGESTGSNLGSFRRSSSDTRRQQQAPKGLWGRELQPGNPPGLWGREASETGNADSNDGPIPGMWGRREAGKNNGHENFQ